MLFHDLHLSFDLHAKHLQQLINYSLQNTEFQPIEFDFRLIEGFEIFVEEPVVTYLELLQGPSSELNMRIETEFALKVVSPGIVIPSFEGRIILLSQLVVTQKSPWFELQYSISSFRWQNPPVRSSTGRKMSLIEKISTILINGLPVIERKIEQVLIDRSGYIQVRDTISQILTGLHIPGSNLVCKSLNVRLSPPVNTERQRITLESKSSTELSHHGEIPLVTEVNLSYEEALGTSYMSLSISATEITQILNNQIDTINKMSDQDLLVIESLSLSCREEIIILRVKPQGLFKIPFDMHIAISYDAISSLLELTKITVVPDGRKGIVSKTFLKFFSSKIKRKILQYFPIDLNVAISSFRNQLKKYQEHKSPPFWLTIPEVRIVEIVIQTEVINIVATGKAKFESRDQNTA